MEELKNLLVQSDHFSESNKLDLAVDIENIRDQLAKSKPDKGIIKSLWSGVEKAATTAGLASSIAKIAPLIAGLL